MERWERVKYVMEYFNLNKNSFSKEIGLSTNTTIGRLLNEKRNPSDSTLKKISERFDVNIDWLKIGNGKMLNNTSLNQTINNYIDKTKILDQLKELKDFKTKIQFAKYLEIKPNVLSNWYSRNSFDIKVITKKFPDVNYNWLLTGEGNMLKNSTTENIDPNNKNQLKNNNSNSFIQLDSNCFLMKIPLLEIEDQPAFINKHQEEDFLHKIESFHSIVVNNIHEKKYIAFRVKGDSMDNSKSNGIISNSIVSCRELQKSYWKSELKLKKFPFWMIATTQNTFPLLKQITAHDTKKGTIICHSLNESIEYRDFELNLNDVIGLYYVIDVQKNIADIEY